MNETLLINMFYAAPELWYTLGLGLIILLAYIGTREIKILKLNQRNYFLNRDRERFMPQKMGILPLFTLMKK